MQRTGYELKKKQEELESAEPDRMTYTEQRTEIEEDIGGERY